MTSCVRASKNEHGRARYLTDARSPPQPLLQKRYMANTASRSSSRASKIVKVYLKETDHEAMKPEDLIPSSKAENTTKASAVGVLYA